MFIMNSFLMSVATGWRILSASSEMVISGGRVSFLSAGPSSTGSGAAGS
jgi:hypothetical protein